MPKAKSIYIFGQNLNPGNRSSCSGSWNSSPGTCRNWAFSAPSSVRGRLKDDAIRLISNRYHLPFPNRIRYGMTYGEGPRSCG